MTFVQQLIGPHMWVKRTPKWSAVLDTIALPLFRDHQRDDIMQWIDLEERTIDWPHIHDVAVSFGREQIILLRIAHALYNGGDCQLSELAQLSSAGRSAAILLIGQRYRE